MYTYMQCIVDSTSGCAPCHCIGSRYSELQFWSLVPRPRHLQPHHAALLRMRDWVRRGAWVIRCSNGNDCGVENHKRLLLTTTAHRAGVLHAAAVCQFEPAIVWKSVRGYGPPLAQGGSGHGLHLHTVFDLPSTNVLKLLSNAHMNSPDNATAWQPAVFDCGRTPLILSGYFQHVEYADAASHVSRNHTR